MERDFFGGWDEIVEVKWGGDDDVVWGIGCGVFCVWREWYE